MSFKKKSFLVLVMAIVLVTFTWAVGQEEKEAGSVELVVWDFKYGEVNGAQPAMKATDQYFMQTYPNVKVLHEAQPNAEYYNIVRAAVTAGSGPDVVMFHGGPNQWEYSDFQIDLDEYIADWRNAIPEESWTWCSAEGTGGPVKMVPITRQGIGFYYNKENFKKAGLDPENPPTDWDNFISACEALKAADITPITYGDPITSNFFLREFVATLFKEEEVKTLFQKGNAGFEHPRFKTAVDYLLELKEKGFFAKEELSFNYFGESRQAFSNGQGGIFVGLLSDIAHWKDFSDGFGPENVGYFKNINLPESVVKDIQIIGPAGIGYSIMTWSKNKQVAADYLETWGNGKGAENFLLMTGAFVPSTKLDMSSVSQKYPVLENIIKATTGKTTSDFVAYVENNTVIREGLNRHINLLITAGETTPEEFVTGCQNKLKEYW